jgi:hypothetical protein
MTLRYEDLVGEPERELRRICEFIGEDYEAGMLDARAKAANVAAEHEWWKASVSGPLQTSSIGRWHDEMSADARRFAALHLAEFLRQHDYEGAEEARGHVALLPGADAVGPRNESLLLELARRGSVVVRPAPATPMAQHRQRALVFLGARGQLDPTRGQRLARRIIGTAMLGMGLLARRVQGRPVLWVRRGTLRQRRRRDPAEQLLALVLRVLTRQVKLEDVPELVDRAG